ncbi:hypothetical protein E2C01_089741 [Portunus trituberculatus]|uniref:Uncharacterized protein n=1 Tax=Portunus trituberculatus TaxID=210409 RepID=A0A5B7JN98_PORTR|nr:hypothetical protein [Portunus trituberculatus]
MQSNETLTDPDTVGRDVVVGRGEAGRVLRGERHWRGPNDATGKTGERESLQVKLR